jgi:hypothetical protein
MSEAMALLEQDREAVAGASALALVRYPLIGWQDGSYGIWFYAEYERKTVVRRVMGFASTEEAARAIQIIQAREVIDAADVYAADVADDEGRHASGCRSLRDTRSSDFGIGCDCEEDQDS